MRLNRSNFSQMTKLMMPVIALALFMTSSFYSTDATASKVLFKQFVNKSANNGYWRGKGVITSKAGEKENLRCIATYFLSDNGLELKQNLRCASESYSIKARSLYKTEGNKIVGTWREETFEIRGKVSGKSTGKTMQISVRGQHVNAEMSVVVKKCSQVIQILPKDAPITDITMQFGRC